MLICYIDLLLLVLKPVVLFNISVFILFMNINLKEMAFEIKIFCNLNIFTVTLNIFIVKLMHPFWKKNKLSINEKLLTSNFWMVAYVWQPLQASHFSSQLV